MKKALPLFIAIITFSIIIVKGQNFELKGHDFQEFSGLNYFSIKQNLSEFPEDSIRFLVTGNLQEKKPIVVFVPGSGNAPLMLSYNNDSFLFLAPLHNIMIEHRDSYHFVLISKPGVPICLDRETTPTPWYMDTITISKTFWECDMLEYHVNATKEVLKFIHQQNFADTSKIYLAGHSQGAEVVAKVAAENPDLITKVAYMSSGIFGRLTEEVIQLYLNVTNKSLTHTEFVEQLDSTIYQRLQNSKYLANHPGKNEFKKSHFINYLSHVSNYSFNRSVSVLDLMKIKVPLLVVYGTADIGAIDCSLLPLFLFDTDVEYTLKAYPNYEHNYFLVGDDGERIHEEYHFHKVFNDVLKWFDD